MQIRNESFDALPVRGMNAGLMLDEIRATHVVNHADVTIAESDRDEAAKEFLIVGLLRYAGVWWHHRTPPN